MIKISGKEVIQKQASDMLTDESRYTEGIPSEIYFPETTEELHALIKKLYENKKNITISGAKTGITGGAVPVENSALISLSKLNKILSVVKHNNDIQLDCEPGITLSEIDQFLKNPQDTSYKISGSELIEESKWFYPPDPTEMTAQLGGTVATNASGARSYKYGATRESITALSVMLSNGEILSLSREDNKVNSDTFKFSTKDGNIKSLKRALYKSPKVKNAAGYYSNDNMSLLDLFIGSEGTLGIISGITIKLQRRPLMVGGLSFFKSSKEAFHFANFLRTEKEIAAIEYFGEETLSFLIEHREMISHKLPNFPKDNNCAIYWEHCNQDTLLKSAKKYEKELNKCDSSLDITWSGVTEKEKTLLKQFRHSVPEVVNAIIGNRKKDCPEIRKVSSDTAVSEDNFQELFQYYNNLIKSNNLQYISFGHLGDFHLHFNILPKNRDEMDVAQGLYKKMMIKAVELGGTVSAEHGIGKLKKDYLKLMYGDKVIDEMRGLKKELDPDSILNPGNLF